jgi:hypothetical protein
MGVGGKGELNENFRRMRNANLEANSLIIGAFPLI